MHGQQNIKIQAGLNSNKVVWGSLYFENTNQSSWYRDGINL